jgi:hypothetical protein
MMKKVLFVCLAMALVVSPAVMLASPVAAQMAVDIDIKPGSDPNSLNVWSKGVLPVAILGSAGFNVSQVNLASVVLTWDGISLPAGAGAEGVSPIRCAWRDVNRDGFMDIVLKYSMKVMIPLTVTHEPPGDLRMTLMGELLDGTHIEGYDTVRIINKKYIGS